MKKTFLFMTGAHQYRLQASSWDEALQIAFEELSPDRDMRAIIRSTLREEGDTRWLVMAQKQTEDETVEERRAKPRAEAV